MSSIGECKANLTIDEMIEECNDNSPTGRRPGCRGFLITDYNQMHQHRLKKGRACFKSFSDPVQFDDSTYNSDYDFVYAVKYNSIRGTSGFGRGLMVPTVNPRTWQSCLDNLTLDEMMQKCNDNNVNPWYPYGDWPGCRGFLVTNWNNDMADGTRRGQACFKSFSDIYDPIEFHDSVEFLADDNPDYNFFYDSTIKEGSLAHLYPDSTSSESYYSPLTCSGFDCSSSNFDLVDSPESITCSGSGCTEEECCIPRAIDGAFDSLFSIR
tara:strand:- start:108 stop:908 length:801 start_codon:yes stop_codon:yes gene_type:complete